MSDWNKKIIEEFRANAGKVGGYFENTPLVLLHTIGAKSGLPRLNPLAYVEDDNSLMVVASKGGAPTHPDWYFNVKANPEVTIEVGTEKYQAIATIIEEDPERQHLFNKMSAVNPGFKEYEEKTERKIPVILLKRTHK